MAAPHVSGGAALLKERDANYSHNQIKELIQKKASKNKIQDAMGAPNLLLRTKKFRPIR